MTAHDFEIRPGVNRVDLLHGFTQVHVQNLGEPLIDSRLSILKAVGDSAISLDFLKLTHNGVSFLVPSPLTDQVRDLFGRLGVNHTIETGRSILRVYAINMRDEEGLMAGILHQAIELGCRVGHVGDMHDNLMLVIETEGSEAIAERFRQTLMGATA